MPSESRIRLPGCPSSRGVRYFNAGGEKDYVGKGESRDGCATIWAPTERIPRWTHYDGNLPLDQSSQNKWLKLWRSRTTDQQRSPKETSLRDGKNYPYPRSRRTRPFPRAGGPPRRTRRSSCGPVRPASSGKDMALHTGCSECVATRVITANVTGVSRVRHQALHRAVRRNLVFTRDTAGRSSLDRDFPRGEDDELRQRPEQRMIEKHEGGGSKRGSTARSCARCRRGRYGSRRWRRPTAGTRSIGRRSGRRPSCKVQVGAALSTGGVGTKRPSWRGDADVSGGHQRFTLRAAERRASAGVSAEHGPRGVASDRAGRAVGWPVRNGNEKRGRD